ncbi:50S ribosomal protein L20 [Sedimentisphaera salicampi]|uniref:Large ribosomal subunit protein bL20 n=1 Tax=Sedimentisphaera salicampi TaxID=1941349 RepID=A0A1W6LLW1_9BACT|nr:50S ribosomal protein L20 [Sedimentisphaera salicampi]ARN56778.1 50S ribosomal protein L20 [Sedimentisphaera salicampi]OXU14959.1 50S ribosomal protein L20 [Sedimentisphaera salicampi]
MPRTRIGAAKRRKNKRILKSVKGYRGPSGRQIRLAKEASVRAGARATTDRKLRKRDFRRLWITRISAACKNNDISYSHFINGLKKANINLNRKMLSEIAIDDPAAFKKIAEEAKAAL